MYKYLFFFIAGGSILVVNIKPILNSLSNRKSCSYCADKYKYDKDKYLTYYVDQKEKDITLYFDKRDKTNYRRTNAKNGLEYAALNINIVCGFIIYKNINI